MAALKRKGSFLFFILFFLKSLQCISCDANLSSVSTTDISELLIDKALSFLNGTTFLAKPFKTVTLVNAQKLVNPPYVINKLTLHFEPLCLIEKESCLRKACILDIRQHEQGFIDVLHHSVQCTEFDSEIKLGEIQEKILHMQELEIIKNLDTQILQSSDEQNDRNYVAINPSSFGYCPGCPYELNPRLPGLGSFVEKALQSMDDNDNSDFKHKLISLVRVTRTVLSNSNIILYDLLMEIGESNCLTSSLIERSQCILQSNFPIKMCLVKFEKHYDWSFNNNSKKIMSNNCTDFQNDSEVHASLISNQGLLNEHNSKTKKPEFYDQIAQEAQEVEQLPLNNEEKRPKFADKMKDFDEFLKTLDPTIANSSINPLVEKNTSIYSPIESIRVRRSMKFNLNNKKTARLWRRKRNVLLGAPLSIDLQDPEVNRIINHSFKIFSDTYEGIWEPIITVKNVTKQIVSGSLYKIEVQVGDSTCERGKNTDCKLQTVKQLQDCIIEAWSEPWLDKGIPKVNITCDEKIENRNKRSLRGVNYSQKLLKQAQENLSKEEKLFNEFCITYNKKYDNEEKILRYKIFKENLDVIEELQRNEQGTAKYGVTQFADLTKQEFKMKYLGLKPRAISDDNRAPFPESKIPNIELPLEFDWRHYNVVTPVKNQGSCGSCWAFSVTGNIEGQYALKYGKLYSFSEQELLDCDKIDEACNGGLPDNAYRAIEEIGGLELESDYPYDARKEKCHLDKTKIKVNVRSGLNITTNETEIAQWLVKNGPVSIGINANAMQFYFGGISHPFKFLCNPKDLDHGVLIVGFGVKNYPVFKKRIPYWIIKNSWGSRWGEQGYYRVYRGDGTCGVNQMVTSAILD